MESIYVILILSCTNLSVAINFMKCDVFDGAVHCYFPNITSVVFTPNQSVIVCLIPESSFDGVTVKLYSGSAITTSDPEYTKVIYHRELNINVEHMVTILFNEICTDKPMKNNSMTVCLTSTEKIKWLRGSKKLLILLFEGGWKGLRNFTRAGTSSSFSNCDYKSPAGSLPTKPDHGIDVKKNSTREFSPYYIIIIVGIGLPFLGALLAVVWSFYYRKKENVEKETIEMQVMEGKSTKADQMKAEVEEIDGPCYVNVVDFDEHQEKEVEKFEDSNEVSYIELDFEQDKNKTSKPKKNTGNKSNGLKSFKETPESIYATIAPEVTEDPTVKEGQSFVDDSVAYVNVDYNRELQ